MRSNIVRFVALVFFVPSLWPAHAHACWDGYYAAVGDSVLQGWDDHWDAERARQLALWLPRIDALVEGGVEIYGDTAELPNGQSIRFPGDRYDLLFARISRALGLPRDARRDAMALGGLPFTVQITASRSRLSAVAHAERLLRELDSPEEEFGGVLYELHGFYEAGGFPSLNAAIHVVDDVDAEGVPVYRVVIGAFLSVQDAQVAAERIGTTIGSDVLIRSL